jgi:putative zinc finger/helix-turn-helix YgiT family protein
VPQWICGVCGESVVDEAFGDPVVRAFDVYRNQHGLLHPEKIRRIRQKWSLSQAAFAALLGMSQATINRYELGALQSKKEDELIRACSSTVHMRDLIQRNKHLLTPRQLKAAVQAVDDAGGAGDPAGVFVCPQANGEGGVYRGLRRFDFDRYAAVVVWFCGCVPVLTQTKLYKLLFYADFLACRVRSVSITGVAYRAMPYGPVPDGFNSLRSELELHDYVRVKEATYQNGNTGEEFTGGAAAPDPESALNDAEIAILRQVRDQIGSLTPSQISDLSHEEAAWKETQPKQFISYEKARELSLRYDGPEFP